MSRAPLTSEELDELDELMRNAQAAKPFDPMHYTEHQVFTHKFLPKMLAEAREAARLRERVAELEKLTSVLMLGNTGYASEVEQLEARNTALSEWAKEASFYIRDNRVSSSGHVRPTAELREALQALTATAQDAK